MSSESLNTFSELDATPLHCLIEDLKREIEAKDSLLEGKTECIVQLEERVTMREKEMDRLKLRQQSANQERQSYEKRIDHLQEALREHDRTIAAFRQQNAILGQQLEDMSETLQTYKENLRRTVEEKANVEDECKNQLVTICNLRSALEETKRNGGASVSLPALLGRSGSAGPPSPGNHYQPQHHHYHSNNSHQNHNNSATSATNTSNNNNTSSSSSTSYWSSFWRA